MSKHILHLIKDLNISQLRPWATRLHREFLSPFSEHLSHHNLVRLCNRKQLYQKSHCIELLIEFYTNEYFQKKAYASLPEPFKKLYRTLVWNYSLLTLNEILALHKIKPPKFKYYASREASINNTHWLHFFFTFGYAYHLYDIENQVRVFLPTESILLARTWMTKPKNIELHEQQISGEGTVYSGVTPNVFYQISSLEYGNMLPRKKNGLLRVAFARKLHHKFNIPKFPGQDQEELLTTEVLAMVTQHIHSIPFKDYRNTPADLLRDHLLNVINDDNINYARWFYPLLRLGHNDFHELSINLEPAVTLLKRMNINVWYSIKDLIDYIKLNNLSWAADQSTFQYSRVHFIPALNYEDEQFNSEIKYDQYILSSFIQKTFILFAALGIIDLNLQPAVGTTGPETLLFSDRALSHIRLTDYGAYVIGLTSHYHNDVSSFGSITLDENRLMITIEGNAPCLLISLEPFTTPISKNRYQLNQLYFNKHTSDKEDLKLKINQFKHLLPEGTHLPELWTNFFDDLLSKKEALQVITGYVILKMEKNTKLIHTLAEDLWLREHILKADQFHLIIKYEDFKEAQKRLNKRGFTIANAKAAIPAPSPRYNWW